MNVYTEPATYFSSEADWQEVDQVITNALEYRFPELDDKDIARFWPLHTQTRPSLEMIKHLRENPRGILTDPDKAIFARSVFKVLECEDKFFRNEARASLKIYRVAALQAQKSNPLINKTRNLILWVAAKDTLLRRLKDPSASKMSYDDIVSSKRGRFFFMARHLAMYLTRIILDSSYSEIGRRFGGRDPGTVMHAEKNIITMINGEIDCPYGRESLLVAIEDAKAVYSKKFPLKDPETSGNMSEIEPDAPVVVGEALQTGPMAPLVTKTSFAVPPAVSACDRDLLTDKPDQAGLSSGNPTTPDDLFDRCQAEHGSMKPYSLADSQVVRQWPGLQEWLCRNNITDAAGLAKQESFVNAALGTKTVEKWFSGATLAPYTKTVIETIMANMTRLPPPPAKGRRIIFHDHGPVNV